MATSSPLTEAIIAFFEPLFYGCLMGIFCFGVCVVQTWTYVKHNHDTRLLQAVVAIIFGLTFACTVLNGQIIHFYLLKNFGNFLGITQIAKEVSTFTLLTVLVTVVSDLCFASRIWRLHRIHVGVIALIIATALGSLISGAVLVDEVLKVPLTVTLMDKKHKTAVALINFMAAASQGLSTFALWYSFRVHMDEVANTPQSIFQRLSVSVLFRGGVLTFAQFIIAILYLARPDRLWWTPIHQVLAPLYYMTTVATLNIRRSPSPSEKRDIDLPMVSKLKRDDSILGSRRNTPGPALSPITPTSTGGDPFAHHGRPTPFMEQNPSDTRVSEKAAISRSYEQYPPLEGAEQLQAEPWTPQPDTMEFSNASYPTFTSTPTHSNQDLTGSVSGTGSSKGKGKEKYDEPDLELQSRTSKSIRKLPPVPGAVVVNH